MPKPTLPMQTAPKAIRCNWEDWLPYFDDKDIPEDQKREMIEALWSIIVGFVDLGWEVHPEKTGGQVLDLATVLNAAVINSKETTELNTKEVS